jgi:hypothetical protein
VLQKKLLFPVDEVNQPEPAITPRHSFPTKERRFKLLKKVRRQLRKMPGQLQATSRKQQAKPASSSVLPWLLALSLVAFYDRHAS